MADLPVLEFPGDGPLAPLLPIVNSDNRPFYDGLGEGRLLLRRCASCGRMRSTVAPVCPACREATATWEEAIGTGTVHSWVRYHRPYLPAFAALVPYVVLCVALDEGPRVFGRLREEAGDDGTGDPHAGMRVETVVERWQDGHAMIAFRRSREESEA